jgi:hypothetical protein
MGIHQAWRMPESWQCARTLKAATRSHDGEQKLARACNIESGTSERARTGTTLLFSRVYKAGRTTTFSIRSIGGWQGDRGLMFRYVVLSKRAARGCTASTRKHCKTPTALIPPTIHLVPIEHTSIAPIRSGVQNFSLSLSSNTSSHE